MTDERMDARLRAAGAAWRAATDTAPVVETGDEVEALPTTPGPPRRRAAHRFTLLASAAAVAAALVVGGFFALRGTGDGNRSADQAVALEGTVWRLLGYDDQHQQPNSTATLYVGKDGRLVADDSCTLITGKADARGRHLRVTDLDVRFNNCTDSVGEATFDRGIKTLRSDPTWSTTRGTLTISGAGRTMHFAAADLLLPPIADRPTLTGATWRLTTVVDPRGAQHAVPGKATLRIDRRRLVASDTCNTMSGAVTVDGRSIAPTGGGLAITAIGCPSAVAATAAVVDDVLSGRAQATVLGATLTITRSGSGTLTYQWQPEDERATDAARLTSTTWRLTAVAGARATVDATLRIGADGTLTVDGCAKLTGRAAVGAGTLTTTGLPADAPKGCPDEISTLLSFLGSKPALWSIQRDHLLIYGGSEQGFSLVFDPTTPLPPATARLTGRAWRLTGVEVESGNTAGGSGSSDSGIKLALTAHGYQLGTPCGATQGDATLGERTIRFAQPLLGACQQEFVRDVVKVLDGTASWSISDGQLTLKKGTTTLTFER